VYKTPELEEQIEPAARTQHCMTAAGLKVENITQRIREQSI